MHCGEYFAISKQRRIVPIEISFLDVMRRGLPTFSDHIAAIGNRRHRGGAEP
jgi:hypothetical protein